MILNYTNYNTYGIHDVEALGEWSNLRASKGHNRLTRLASLFLI